MLNVLLASSIRIWHLAALLKKSASETAESCLLLL
jgi:hypothetical protein